MRLQSLLLPLSVGLAAAGSCNVYDSPGECITVKDCKAAGKTSTPNFCPNDPEDILCCTETPDPTIPASNCQAHVIEHGNTILDKHPGAVHVVWCYANKSGEHGKGLALDFMVGAYNPKGQEVAEWVMNNHTDLDVMYVIWGQKIWNPSRDSVTGWDNWRDMEDRGSVTANHWDHPHVSFNA